MFNIFDKQLKCMHNINKYMFLFCCICLHIILSFYFSKFFFKPIFENAGFETIAYQSSDHIQSLNYDNFIREICRVYSYILAVLLIILFWYYIFYIYTNFNKLSANFKISYFLFLFLGLFCLLLIYPYFLTTNRGVDFTYNYVYAKEFLPMHWHGFFTNVFLCSCMIFFPHPVSLSLIPYLLFFNIISYIIFKLLNNKSKSLSYVLAFIFILFLPETIPALTTPGRNPSYSIFSIVYFSILMSDYFNKKPLNVLKYIFLAILVSILATWRTEGIIYIIFFPFCIFFSYLYKRYNKVSIGNIKKVSLYVLILCIIFLALKLPHDYGMKKYYDKDYFIINTPMPLAAVFLSDDANLSYDGVENDLKNINAAYPISYLKDFGGNASIVNNLENGRVSRQCGTGFDSMKYIFSAYNILFHNPIIFMKKQINNYLIANSFSFKFNLKSPENESFIDKLSYKSLKLLHKFNSYYEAGKNDISLNYPLFTKNIICRNIQELLILIYRVWHYIGKHFIKYVKPFITILVIILTIFSLLKKEYFNFMVGSNILAIFLAILLFSPDPHYEYWYATYLCQYLFLASYFKQKLFFIKEKV